MGTERLQTKHRVMRSLDGPFTQSPSPNPQHSPQSLRLSPQQLFLDLSTELLRQGQSIRFQAPGLSMHPTIKEGETITVVPVAPFDIKRGDILLYFVGSKVIAHRVVRIKREKNDSATQSTSHSSAYSSIHASTPSLTQSSRFSPQQLFILRGDASATCDDPVKTQQVLGKVVFVEKDGRSIDLYSRKARMLRIAHAWASRLKRRMILVFLGVRGLF